ncbi:beta-galactosidase [uncultured Fusobacterium sp.]|uniref:beta-galactosidase n=1 Tax=uncultured Fusobacterium sp. TaxID=159267 RepID=UPI0015A701B8|nr:beta-galactosidase [uncultured Fusobacterium sp.]
MLLGVDYYPEQWDISIMEEDLANIKELGSNVIRIGEFAWHLMEKEEGKYDFSFFDTVIKKANEYGLKVIFGTPTATIPAWLVKKYPEILSEFENGEKRTFGGRHIYCFNSEVFYKYSEKIIRELANHYKDEKNIVAWQIDNEFGHEGSDECYCPKCHRAFQEFLRNKFNNSIDELNKTYGTTFWSQEYNSFEEIPVPKKTITTHNPALRLDWERFRSKSIVDYSNFQVELLKSIIPDCVVIHDFPGGGLDKHVDYSKVAQKLNVVAFNNYPVWGGQKEPIPPHEIAFGLDYIRGLKRENFWITEAIMGAQGHDITGFLPRPNQAKMWSCQGMARGCSSLIYFRYRGATKGAEQFCYGILDADNKKRRKFYEVKDFFHNIIKYEDILEHPIKSKVAIVYDYDSLASFRIQKQSILLDCHQEMKKFYKPFYDSNIMVDIISEDKDFSEYKILILPVMIIWKKELTEKVKEFAKNGGIVVMTYRTAVKDIDNNLTLGEMLPVGYNDFVGAYVEETESLQEYNSLDLEGKGFFNGIKGKGGIFRDMLVSKGAEVLFRYNDKFYDTFSAVTKNSYGKGKVYYIGCSPEEAILKLIVDDILNSAELQKTLSPDNVEIVVRGNRDKQIKIYINHNDYEVKMENICLKPFEYKIINLP